MPRNGTELKQVSEYIYVSMPSSYSIEGNRAHLCASISKQKNGNLLKHQTEYLECDTLPKVTSYSRWFEVPVS
jgi:hypothetical protein